MRQCDDEKGEVGGLVGEVEDGAALQQGFHGVQVAADHGG